MRYLVCGAAAALCILSGSEAGAIPLGPGALGSAGWTRGEGRSFVLQADETSATLWIDDEIVGRYDSLALCCSDVLLPLLDSGPGATVTLSRLTLNSLPIDTVIVLSWSTSPLDALLAAGLDNLVRLEGVMTLDWVVLSEPGAVFEAAGGGGDPPPIPEPALVLLVGVGLARLAAGRGLATRRVRRR